MATVFPFVSSEVGHSTGVPIGFDKQTGLPILFNNFHSSLTNYNMVVFGKSGAGKSVTIKTISSRSSVLMGIESLALDAEGEYGIVADSLGGINVVISPSSKTIINLFDVEPEIARDEITGKDRTVVNIENKVEDVTNALLTMARGSTRSQDVNEITKQIIAEAVAEEYQALGINSNPNSLYEEDEDINFGGGSKLARQKKPMPTVGSWYNRILQKASMNENIDYQFHFSYLTKVMRQYTREYDGQMAYFDGQSTFDLKASSCFAQAVLRLIKLFDISIVKSSDCLSNISRLSANRVQTTDASNNLLNPAAISSLIRSTSILISSVSRSLFISPRF